MLLFKDTLTKHLSSKKEDGKVKLKWNGMLIDFVSLILEFKGNWELKHQDNYEIHSFKEAKSKFKITWWPSSKTFIIQGSESSKVIKMVENILNLPVESENELAAEASTKTTPKSKKRSRNKSKSRLNVNSQVSHESEFRKIWKATESLRANVANRTVGSGNISKSQEVTSVMVANRYDVLNSHQDLSDKQDKEFYEMPTTTDKDKEVLRLKSIVSENEKRIHELKNQLMKKEKFIENLKNENFSLKSEKTRVDQSLTHKNSRGDDGVLQTVNSNTNKDKKEDIQERVSKDVGKDQKSTAKSRKPRIFIAGDSMVRELKGWLMSRNKFVKVYSFSSATADDIESFLVPLLNKNPNHIMLHVGTCHGLTRSHCRQNFKSNKYDYQQRYQMFYFTNNCSR